MRSSQPDLRADFAKDPVPVVGFLTTEHNALTSARAATIAEGSSRVSSYLSTVSASLVTLGFLSAGSAGFTRSFFAVAAALFAVCGTVGVLTFRRCVQVTMEDLHMLARIERVRATYIELIPGLSPSLDLADSKPGDTRQVAFMNAGNWTQLLLTMAGFVGVMTAVVAGAAAGCLIRATTGAGTASWIVGGLVLAAAAASSIIAQMSLLNADSRRGATSSPPNG